MNKTQTAFLSVQPLSAQQSQMNEHYRATLTRLLNHAERDERLARACRDTGATATAKARRETLEAALGIYTAAHFHAHGLRPWGEKARRNG